LKKLCDITTKKDVALQNAQAEYKTTKSQLEQAQADLVDAEKVRTSISPTDALLSRLDQGSICEGARWVQKQGGRVEEADH
jgi:hypothetical protein